MDTPESRHHRFLPRDDDLTPASTLNTSSCLSLNCGNCVIAKASAFTRLANAIARPSALRRPLLSTSTSYAAPRHNKRRARSNCGTATSPSRPSCTSRIAIVSSSICVASRPIAENSLISGRSGAGQSDSLSGTPRTPRTTLSSLLRLLFLLSALGDEEVEMERMASATAPKYARGGSVLRRGVRDGVLSSTSASAA